MIFCLIHCPLVALSLPTHCTLGPACNPLNPRDLLSDYPYGPVVFALTNDSSESVWLSAA
jgi:hypothetical protein